MILSLYDYEEYKKIAAKGYPFYSLIACAISQADTDNLEKLKQAFPEIWASFYKRYHAPLGVVEEWDGITPEEYFKEQRRVHKEQQQREYEIENHLYDYE